MALLRYPVSDKAGNIEPPVVPLHEGSEKLSWGYLDLDSTTVVKQTGGGLTGLTEIGAYVAVEPQTTMTIPAAWDIDPRAVRPIGPSQYEYRLKVQKQPGMNKDAITVAVQLPSGAKLITTSAGMVQKSDGWLVYQGQLNMDTELAVSFGLAN